MAQEPNFEYSPDADAAYDRLDNSGMFDPATIRVDIGVEAAHRIVRTETKPSSRHPDHRGGRAYPEPSDSELDPDWNVRPEPLTPEQQEKQNEINRRGLAMLAELKIFEQSAEYAALSGEPRRVAHEQKVDELKKKYQL